MAPRAQPAWHPERIKVELRLKFGPITTLSERWGYSRQAISQVLGRPGYSNKLEQQIAEALGVSLHELWPSRYAADGTPIRLREFEPIEAPRRRTSQNAAAA